MRRVMAGCISKCHYFGKTNLESLLTIRVVAAMPRTRRVHWVLDPKPREFTGWRRAARRTAQALTDRTVD